MMARAGSACSTDCYSGSRFWIRSNHVESILDPSCHTWTLKYVFRWKVLFIFLYSGSHRKWSSVHIPAGFCSTPKPLESSAAARATAPPSPRNGGRVFLSAHHVSCSSLLPSMQTSHWEMGTAVLHRLVSVSQVASGSSALCRIHSWAHLLSGGTPAQICQGQHFTVRGASKQAGKKDG